MEQLGRAVDAERPRGARIGLQRGGYYLVDMKAYMSHYLTLTSAEHMPPDAIIEDSQARIFGEELLGSPKLGRVVICVHGFNVHLHEAHTAFSTLVDSLDHTDALRGRIVTSADDVRRAGDAPDGHLIAFLGFSWPSDGSVLSYRSDQNEAATAGAPLANLLSRIHVLGEERKKAGKPGLEIDMVCHSMGNYLACSMLSALVNEEFHAIRGRPEWFQRGKHTRFLVNRLIMLAPDVERRHVTKCVSNPVAAERDKKDERVTFCGKFYSGIDNLVEVAHNFYSRFDAVLALSNVEKAPREAVANAKGWLDRVTFGLVDWLERNPQERWEQRLGATRHPPNSPPQMLSHNAAELSNREIGHGDYIDCAPVVMRIAAILGANLQFLV